MKTLGEAKLPGRESAFYLRLVRARDARRTETELRNYRRIRHADLGAELRISRLQGLVQEESSLVYNLPLTYIDCRNKTFNLRCREHRPACFPAAEMEALGQAQTTY